MLRSGGLFVAPGLSSSVIEFMGDLPLEGSPRVFKIPGDKSWTWPELKFWNDYIEVTTHFIKD